MAYSWIPISKEATTFYFKGIIITWAFGHFWSLIHHPS